MTSERDIGVSVAILGIDGAGKSTLVKALKQTFDANKIPVTRPTWQTAITDEGLEPGYPRSTIEQLVIEGWRLMYSAPKDREAFLAFPGIHERHGSDGLAANLPDISGPPRQAALVVSALVEMAGDHLLAAECGQAAIDRGAVSIADGFGFRNITKMLLLAKAMKDRQVDDAALDVLAEAVTMIYGGSFLQPDIGLFLDADPELSYRWLVEQRGETGMSEDFSLLGDDSEDSYLRFQTALAKVYRTAAKNWGWHVLPVDGRPQSETIDAALDIVAKHPALADRLTNDGPGG